MSPNLRISAQSKKGIDPSSQTLANIGLLALLEMKPGFELFDSPDLGSGEL